MISERNYLEQENFHFASLLLLFLANFSQFLVIKTSNRMKQSERNKIEYNGRIGFKLIDFLNN